MSEFKVLYAYLRCLIHFCRLAGGLAWLGVLLFGVVSEQVKTRLEDRAAEEGTKVSILEHDCP